MKKITYSWGHGYTDLFLSLDGKTPKILDVESDHNKLHEMCGGRTTFVSRSGNSGEGFFDPTRITNTSWFMAGGYSS